MMHWSLCLTLLLAITFGFTNPSIIVAAASFWAIILLHEVGHMYLAQKLGLEVISIHLHLVHGSCHYQRSEYDYNNYLVAWGGFLAQAAVFIPAITIFTLWGDQLHWVATIPLVFLGHISAMIALMSLAPSKGYDGDTCWKAIPLYFKHRKPLKPKKSLTRIK